MSLRRLLSLGLLLAAVASSAGCLSLAGDTLEERRAHVRSIRDEILVEAYAADPSLEEKVKAAPGYAVLNTGVIKVLVPGIAKGYGLVVDNRTGEETFLNNWAIALGLGIEVCTRRGLVILESEEALRFVGKGGWDFGAETAVGLKFGNFGGAADAGSLGGGVYNEKLFQNGVSLHASLVWMRFGQHEALNRDPAP